MRRKPLKNNELGIIDGKVERTVEGITEVSLVINKQSAIYKHVSDQIKLSYKENEGVVLLTANNISIENVYEFAEFLNQYIEIIKDVVE